MLLPTGFWVDALRHRAERAGAFVVVSRRGDDKAGSVLIKVLNQTTREVYVLREAASAERSVWMKPLERDNEPDLDLWIRRQVDFDPDLWVVEIEDREGRHFLTEDVDLS